MVQSLIGKNALPADTAQIDFYHVKAGFFIGFVFSEIFFGAKCQIPALSEIAGSPRPSVSGRFPRIGSRLDLNKKNVCVIFTNDIGFQMPAPIIAVKNPIAF